MNMQLIARLPGPVRATPSTTATPLTLYHFTARERLDSIMEQGLTRGEVPLTPFHCLNAVWFTQDRRPEGHGLCDAYELSDRDKRIMGLPVAESYSFPNKRAVRITVKLSPDDPNLVRWSRWGRRNVSRVWYDTMNKTGGGKAWSWWIYWGAVSPSCFCEVWDLVADQPITTQSSC